MNSKNRYKNWFAIGLFLGLFFHCKNDIQRPPLFTIFTSFETLSSSEKAAVITTDYGGAGRINLINTDLFLSTPSFASIHSDAVGRYHAGKLYVINRMNRDSIMVLNPSLGFLPEKEFSVEQGSNPQDIAIINSEKAYISRYNRKTLAIVNLSSNSITKTIDLSTYSETTSTGSTLDNSPEMNKMLYYNNRVYVQLQRLDKNDVSGLFKPNADSYLIEIDPSTDTVSATHTIPFRNPFSKIYKVNFSDGIYLVMAAPGNMGFLSSLDGGVVAFHPETKSFKILYKETEAGGDILDVQIKNDTLGFAFVVDSNFNKQVQAFNPSTGAKIKTIAHYSNSMGNLSGFALSKTGKLYTGDANFSTPGVMIYDSNKEDYPIINSRPISLDLKPFEIIVLEE